MDRSGMIHARYQGKSISRGLGNLTAIFQRLLISSTMVHYLLLMHLAIFQGTLISWHERRCPKKSIWPAMHATTEGC